MEGKLRDNLPQWDTNKDRFIDLAEYKTFFRWKMEEKAAKEALKWGPPAVEQKDDELDRRPTVYRAGKLPAGLPKWFLDFDLDKDGQVSLFEWRKHGKSIEEFLPADRNQDGLLTPSEVLRHVANLEKLGDPSTQSAAWSIRSAAETGRKGTGGDKGGKPKPPKKDKKPK